MAGARPKVDPATAMARCLHPDCDVRLSWSSARGRPALFCSRRHQQNYTHLRARLVAQASEARQALADLGGDTEQARCLKSELSLLRWMLVRMPSRSPSNHPE
jgi:hypothetical protein